MGLIRVVFMGTPDFAVPPLRALIDSPHYNVVGVVTQPDRPAGRGQSVQASPVKHMAASTGIPLLQPEKLRAPGVIEHLQGWAPDLIVVAAFGQILRQNVLDLPHWGCINIHASLLPRWRGAAPIQAAIRAGDAQTGITIMQMDAGLDTGPLLAARAIPIASTDTGGTLHDKLAELGAPLLIETLDAYVAGQITPQPQDEAAQTYAPMLKKEDGQIDWATPAEAIARTVRAFDPWPGTATIWHGASLKILGGAAHSGSAPIGEVLLLRDGAIGVGTSDGVIALDRVQLAGRGAVGARDFVRGHADFVGSTLGSDN